VEQSFTKSFSTNTGEIVVDNNVFHLSISRSVPEIFAIKVQSCHKLHALLILGWSNETPKLLR